MPKVKVGKPTKNIDYPLKGLNFYFSYSPHILRNIYAIYKIAPSKIEGFMITNALLLLTSINARPEGLEPPTLRSEEICTFGHKARILIDFQF